MPGGVILFVCTGNICRSPMAEYLLRRRLGPESPWKCESAGTSAIEGQSASLEACVAVRAHGIDMASHESRPLTSEIIGNADLVVVMTSAHRDDVIEMVPEASEKVFLLKSFGSAGAAGDIADPIGCSNEIYRQTMKEIDGHLSDLVVFLNELDGELR